MIRLARWVVAAAFLVVLAMVAFYLKGGLRSTGPAPEPVSPTPSAPPASPKPAISERTRTTFGNIKVVISKEGERTAVVEMQNAQLLDRKGVWSGEDVQVTSTTSQGVVQIRGAQGWVDRTRNHYRLEGDVHVERDDGTVLMADKATHHEVEGYDQFEGRVWVHKGTNDMWAGFIEYRSELGLLNLDRGVRLFHDAPDNPVAAVGRKGNHERKPGEVVQESAALFGSVVITAPDMELRGHSLDVMLAEGKPEQAWLRPEHKRTVHAILTRPPGCDDRAAVVFVETQLLRAGFDGEGRLERLTTQLKRGATTHAEALDEDWGLVWELTTSSVVASFNPETGTLQQVQTGGHTRFIQTGEEAPSSDPVELEAGAVVLRYRPGSGALERAELRSGVVLKRGGAVLRGQEGQWRDEILTVTGEPVLSEPGVELEARLIELTEAGDIKAREDVICLIQPKDDSGAGEDREEQPRVQITSQSMQTEDEGRWVVFRGEARATRGETLLEAQSIKLSRPEGDLVAEGEAHLVTIDAEENSLSAHAQHLLLAGDGRVMELDREVTLLLEEITLSAEGARLTLKADGRTAEELVAWGEEVLTDRGEDRVTSERVVYNPGTGRAVFTSKSVPARYVDAQGYEYKGFSLTVDRGDDRIFIGSETTDTGPSDNIARTTIPEAQAP